MATRIKQLRQLREAADAVQDVLSFTDKVALSRLGIDPQAIDDPVVRERIRLEEPTIFVKLGG